MSVLSSKRKTSSMEVLSHPNTIRQCLKELMIINFGIRDVDDFARLQYAHGIDDKEYFETYRILMYNHKNNLVKLFTRLVSYLCMANQYPSSSTEYENRTMMQKSAVAICNCMKKELQEVVEDFKVDINKFETVIHAIDREIGLINDWRQADHKRFSKLNDSFSG